MSTSPSLDASINSHLARALKADGFAGSGRIYRRVIGDLIHVVSIQGSRSGGQFSINLAIHPTCIPDVLGEMPDAKKISDTQCEFRRRLAESGSDQWWKYESSSDSMDAAVKAATIVYCDVGRKLFAHFCSEDSPLHTLTAQALEKSEYDLYGFTSTKVRTALALARFRKVKGHIVAAHEFARVGEASIGKAVALRRAFERIYAEVRINNEAQR